MTAREDLPPLTRAQVDLHRAVDALLAGYDPVEVEAAFLEGGQWLAMAALMEDGYTSDDAAVQVFLECQERLHRQARELRILAELMRDQADNAAEGFTVIQQGARGE